MPASSISSRFDNCRDADAGLLAAAAFGQQSSRLTLPEPASGSRRDRLALLRRLEPLLAQVVAPGRLGPCRERLALDRPRPGAHSASLHLESSPHRGPSGLRPAGSRAARPARPRARAGSPCSRPSPNHLCGRDSQTAVAIVDDDVGVHTAPNSRATVCGSSCKYRESRSRARASAPRARRRRPSGYVSASVRQIPTSCTRADAYSRPIRMSRILDRLDVGAVVADEHHTSARAEAKSSRAYVRPATAAIRKSGHVAPARRWVLDRHFLDAAILAGIRD